MSPVATGNTLLNSFYLFSPKHNSWAVRERGEAELLAAEPCHSSTGS